MYSQKRFSHDSLLTSTKYFPNRIIIFCLEFWYSVEKYCMSYYMQPVSCQHWEQHISNQSYEISVVQEYRSTYFQLELHRWCLEFVISFFKVHIWDWGLAYSFWDHVIHISIRRMNFQYIFSRLWKVKNFCGNIHSILRNIYFGGIVMYVQYGFLYLYLTRPKLTV
jgi:hypothetical protein